MSDPLRVLVVEDDPATRRAIVRALESIETRVTCDECHDGFAACERLREPFDAALLDYQLPRRNGLQILREVRAAGVRIPIIILTARGDEELAVELMKAGASDYLSKARMSPETLWQSLRGALRVHEAEQKAAAAQEELRANEERLQRILQANADGILLVDCDGRFTFANPAVHEMMGVKAGELVGRTNEDPGFVRTRLDGSALPPGERPLDRVLKTGQPVRSLEAGIIRQDGSRIIVSINAVALRDADGRIAGAVLSSRDITQRKHAEEALRASNERLAGLINASPLPIVSADMEGNVTSWNPAAERTFGWTATEAIGHPPPFVPPEKQAEYRDLLMRSLTEGGLTGAEIHRQRRDGAWLDLNLSTAPVHNAAGEITGTIAIIEDITQAKRLQEQLLQAHRMETVGRLAGGIAHDFNNLLAVISGYSESLQRRMPAADPLRQQVEEIERAADRGAALTRQLLAFSRRQAIEPRDLDLNPLVTSVCQMLRRVITDKIEIKVETSSPLGLVKADASQMEQVLVNLALNARDAMPAGGTLTITTANLDLTVASALPHALPPGQYVSLSVRDTGCGMAPDVQSRMFEPFYTTKDTQGTGLGLSIVYGIVEQAGGKIEVASEPGAGATFEVILPRAT